MDGGSVEVVALKSPFEKIVALKSPFEKIIGVGSSGPSAQSLGVGHGLEVGLEEGLEHELSLGVSRIVSFRDALSWERQEDWPDRPPHLRRVLCRMRRRS